jgi:hypothetical protein
MKAYCNLEWSRCKGHLAGFQRDFFFEPIGHFL